MYNGSAGELSLFQASTSVSFPLLQKAVNGTPYGAWRDEMMLIDQTGTQRVLIDVRRDPNWQTIITDEIDRLVSTPIGRFASDPLALSDIRVGDRIETTLKVVNDGRFGLTLSEATSNIPDISLTIGSRTLAPGDTAIVQVAYQPTSEGAVSGSISIKTPGALVESISLPFEADVLPPLIPRLAAPVSGSIDLGSVETERVGTYAYALVNEGSADLVVSVSETSENVRGLGETRIAPGKMGSIRFTLDLTSEGPFSGQLILTTNDPDTPTLTVPVTATGIVVPPERKADLDLSGTVDFADFLIFANAFGTADAASDFDGNGAVDFADFLTFAQSFGKQID